MIANNSILKMEDVRQYLQMLQDIINRMASNSSNCKAWAITLYSAMAALLIGIDEMRQWFLLILIPVFLFYLLDAYYLGLENDFRNLETSFIERLRSSDDCSSFIYEFNYTKAEGYKKWKNLTKGLTSCATWPLYFTLAAISIVVAVVFVFTAKPSRDGQQLEESLHQLVVKQDSILKIFNTFNDKYEPVSVESKTFHNPLFFRADNVDSVEVKSIRK